MSETTQLSACLTFSKSLLFYTAMILSGRALSASALAFFVLAGGCASYDSRLNNKSTKYLGVGEPIISQESKEDLAMRRSYWDGDGIDGAPSIVINLTLQSVSFYKGDKLVGVSAISSGREGHDTPVGSYKIIGKKIDQASNLYGDFVDANGTVVVKNVSVKDPMPPGTKFRGAPMPYFMRLTNTGVGMHQGFLPGVPDSHGCIRMPEKMVKKFWDNTPIGTPVQIVN
jgi:L,D-transpeptidase catalytic domain